MKKQTAGRDVLDGVGSEIGGEAVLLFDLAGAKAIA